MRCSFQIQVLVSGHGGKRMCPRHSSGKIASLRKPRVTNGVPVGETCRVLACGCVCRGEQNRRRIEMDVASTPFERVSIRELKNSPLVFGYNLCVVRGVATNDSLSANYKTHYTLALVLSFFAPSISGFTGRPTPQGGGSWLFP